MPSHAVSALRQATAHALLAGVLCLPLAVRADPGRPAEGLTAPAAEEAGIAGAMHAAAAAAARESGRVMRQVGGAATELALSALEFIGVPYRRGGSSAEHGFDCSGFTRHVFERTLGLVLPHRALEQAQDASLHEVTRAELMPGDLVFFDTMRRAFSHVGIYLGEGRFVHAPRRGALVRVEDLHSAYWVKRFNGARRAVQVSAALQPGVAPAPGAEQP